MSPHPCEMLGRMQDSVLPSPTALRELKGQPLQNKQKNAHQNRSTLQKGAAYKEKGTDHLINISFRLMVPLTHMHSCVSEPRYFIQS